MKVRIAGNKIRLRLKEPEVREFEKKGLVAEVLEFGDLENEQLKFRMVQSKTDAITINFRSNEITLVIPETQAQAWTNTDLVGFNAEVDTGKGKRISVLVEKDFVCMDGREEDNVGSYPNPLAKS